ncbi:MAG TPA: hypothetical protein VHS78_00795 [Candidatus Elarobacter sp.]|jgi:hypothetical protein|nr:hypothetical protein [Candidatus Elarobacter sp.]
MIRIRQEAQQTIAAFAGRADVETGSAKRRHVAMKRPQRHAETPPIVRIVTDSARANRGEPDEAYEPEGNAFTGCVRGARKRRAGELDANASNRVAVIRWPNSIG